MNIVSGVTAWAIIPVLLTGLIYASVLYVKNTKLPFSKRLKWLLFAFRFTVVSLIAFLLLSPHLVLFKKVVEKPLILIAQDNSASMLADSLSLQYENEALHSYLAQRLSNKAEVRLLTFGSETNEGGTVDFMDQKTDISNLLLATKNTFFNRNIGALVMVSDGIHNSGIQPELTAASYPFPIYSLALGDTNQYPDLRISDVRYNRLVYQQDRFPVEISVQAFDADEQTFVVELLQAGKVLASEKMQVRGKHYNTTKQFMISSPENGRIRLTARVSELSGERLVQNNRRSFFVDVVNEKQKILLFSLAPHPDLGAIKTALADHYEIDQAFARDPLLKGKSYNLLILHNVPSSQSGQAVIAQLLKENPEAALLFITGRATDFAALNALQPGPKFLGGEKLQWVEAVAEVNSAFSLFATETGLQQRVSLLPALEVPLLETQLPPGFQSFMFQKVNGIQTTNPLIGFFLESERPAAYILGNGIWKWRLADFQKSGSHSDFDAIIQKITQLLLVRKDTRRLRIFHEAVVMLNEAVRFRAEVYNQSMEKTNAAELTLKLTHSADETEYRYLFNVAGDGYSLNAGRLPEGDYHYQADVRLGDELLSEKGTITVEPSSLENMVLKADHALLKRIAALTGGKIFLRNEVEQLINSINDNRSITSTASYPKVYDSLINTPWLISLIVLLLFVEWLLRKSNGLY